MTAVEDRLAEIEARADAVSPPYSATWRSEMVDLRPALSLTAAALRAVLAQEDLLSDGVGHLVYEATEMEPEECTDECPACAIEDMYAAIATALSVTL